MAKKKQSFWGKLLDWIDNLFKWVEQEGNYIPKFKIEKPFYEKGAVMYNAVGGKGLVRIPARVTRIAEAYKNDASDPKFCRAVEKSQFITGLELPVGLRAIDTMNISGLKNLVDIYVPDLVDFCKCKLDGEVFNAFSFVKNLYVNGELIRDLVIPNEVESIREWQFYGFHIKSVTIPSNVKSIKNNAFNAHVEKFIFEGKEIELDANFFRNFSKLKEIVVFSDELEFSPSMFMYCGELEKITYPNNPKKTRVLIDTEKDCKVENGELIKYVGHARKLTVPSTVKKIASGAFVANEYLEEIVIPDSVKEIGARCFEECRKLKVVQLPSTLKTIADSTFLKCYCLESIRIPDGVTCIGDNVFDHCRALKEIEIGKGVKKIGQESFCDCEKLEKIVLPSVKEIGERAFCDCGRLKKIVMEGNVEKIGGDAFYQLNADLYFLGSVKKIGKWNLSNNRVHVRDISVWSNAEVFYEKPKKTLNCELAYKQYKSVQWKLFCDGKEVKEVIIPEEVDSVPAGNFYGCQSIETVRFQGDVKTIGAFAFCGCVSLENVEFPDSLREIGECAFMGCRLKEISLPENVTLVKRGTFANCNLAFVKLPSELTGIETYAFTDNRPLSSVRIPEKLKKSGNYAIAAFDESCEWK